MVYTIVVGDSITAMGKPYLQELKPGWKINGVPGRKVCKAEETINLMLDEHGIPNNLVIALGQNPCEGWSKADYRDLVRLVPSSTDVFFVTTYRDPAVFGEEAAETQRQYSAWMIDIAENQPNVYIIPWRKYCLDGTVTLQDGSHPDEPSRQFWAELIVSVVSN